MAVARYARWKAEREAKARAPRIGAELGLGNYLGTWDGGNLRGRFVGGCLLLPFSLGFLIPGLSAGSRHPVWIVIGCILLAINVPMLRFPWCRGRWVHHYEGDSPR